MFIDPFSHRYSSNYSSDNLLHTQLSKQLDKFANKVARFKLSIGDCLLTNTQPEELTLEYALDSSVKGRLILSFPQSRIRLRIKKHTIQSFTTQPQGIGNIIE